ncbi:MAG TPA: ATP cone domain-containing protein [Candidatus Saccharimonadales bacterium]|jgi:transcriptional regulator NrdR family protein|nr:ATP cone domain-containing protein [Candidatus Saccharimonadales bacterium]
MGNLKVQKKDGTVEDFDRSKIKNGILSSGAPEDQAENVTAQIENWATTAAVDGVIKALDIKMKLLELLDEINPAAKATFENYKKA